MARAKVTLLDSGPVSFRGREHSFNRGESKTITTESDILYFQQQVGFSVEFEEGTPSKAVKVSAARADISAVGNKKKSKAPPAPKDEPVDGVVTEEELSELTPKALSEHLDSMGYEVPEKASKEELIKLILQAQADDS